MRAGLLCILLILVFFSCRKYPPNQILPEQTKSGQHTLGFLLNGEPWVPYDRGNHEAFELPHPVLNKDGSLKISATRIDETSSARNWFCIEIPEGCFKEGTYTMKSNVCTTPYQTFYYGDHKGREGEYYAIDPVQPHFIEVTYLNKKQQVISGTFEFDAVSEQQDTLRIRSGRFDLKFDTY